MNNQVNMRYEGAFFFAQLIGHLERVSQTDNIYTAEIQLRELILQYDLLNVLLQGFFEQQSYIGSEALLLAIEIVFKIIRLADKLNVEAVFEVFEKQGCLEAIEDLQTHTHDSVRNSSYTVIVWYNNLNEGKESQNEILPNPPLFQPAVQLP